MEPDYDKVIRELHAALDKAEKFPAFAQPSNSSASNININAGGPAVWLCATFCALCLLTSLFTLWIVTDIRQNDRDQGNQLNAIYQYAPYLRPKEKP